MKKLVKYTLLGILTTGVLGLVSVFAQTDTTTRATDTTTQQEMQDPAIKGSILLNKDPMAQYLTLAKVSMADAVAAAQKAVATTEGATSASLQDENGYLVWAIVVAGQEVKVDAGTAEVLDQQAVNVDEMDGDEQGDEQGGDDQGGNEMNHEQGGDEQGGDDQGNGEQMGDEQGNNEQGGDEQMGGNENNDQNEHGEEQGGESNN
jgi:hypothetical protein